MYYDILYLEPSASEEDIKNHYKMLAKAVHPDKHANNASNASMIFRDIEKVYTVLSNPITKSIYDAYGVEGLKIHDGYKYQFEDIKRDDIEVRHKTIKRYRMVKMIHDNCKSLDMIDHQRINIHGSLLLYFISNHNRWIHKMPYGRLSDIEYEASLKYNKSCSLSVELDGTDGSRLPTISHQYTQNVYIQGHPIQLNIVNELTDPQNFTIEVSKWNHESISHKISLRFNNMIPSLTFRQIYSSEGIYIQLYEEINIYGYTAGTAMSKSYDIGKNASYNVIVKTNFKAVNINHKMVYNINNNMYMTYKLVSAYNV